MAAKTIITPTTDAVSDVNVNLTGLKGDYTFMATGLGTEAIDIEFSVDDGSSGEDASQSGVQVQLTAGNNILTVLCPIFLRVSKPSTSSAAGVFAFIPYEI